MSPRRIGAYVLRILLVLFITGATLWTGAVGCLWVNEARLVFNANRSRVIRPVAYRDLLQLSTGDGVTLDAAVLLAEPASDYWMLFAAPAAGTIHGRLQSQLYELQALGYNVLAFDYRGFGRNAGRPSESGLYEDASTAYRYLVDTRGVPPSRIVLAGRSLGSAVAVELSTRVPSAGLLLLSALDSVPAAAARFYPWAPVHWLASLRFDALTKAPRVRAPVVMVHGLRDRVIPISAARAMFGRFPEPKQFIETDGGHNRAGFGDGASLATALGRFWPVLEPAARDSE